LLKNKILDVLEQKKGTVVTGGQLANALCVSRNAIWKAIHNLQEEGKQILSIPNVGYKLLETDDSLSEQLIRSKLSTSFIGQSLEILPTVNSTNQYLKELDTACFENGFAVIADEQLQGRGRRSRTFVSSKGEGIFLSILLKLDGRRNDIRLLTICTAVAVSKAIESVCRIDAEIKWVNDVFCNGKKICGILTEAVLSGELQELDTVVVGMGINTGAIPSEIKEIATSIKEETGMCGIRNDLIAQLLNKFEAVYLDYTVNGKASDIIEYYESKLFIKGQQVLVLSHDSEYPATVLGIDDTGALIVEDSTGAVEHLVTGEIKINQG